MATVLVTGANRGIGYALVDTLLKHPHKPKILIATCRDVDRAQELQDLTTIHPELRVLKLNVTDFGSYPEFVEQVKSIVGSAGLNLLINNAGYKKECEDIDKIDVDSFKLTVDTNLIAPVMLTQALLPLIKTAAAVNQDKPISIHKAAIVNMSSLLGSLTLNNDVVPIHSYCYRESKAGLNQFTRTLWAELKPLNILVVSLHPGWVQTDMGGQYAEITVKESVDGIVSVLFKLNSEMNGRFWVYDGKEMAW